MKFLTVTDFNYLIKHTIEDNIKEVEVIGEVTNFIEPTSGHWYFTLKDINATIRCCMFRGSQKNAECRPENGKMMQVCGTPSLFVPRGDTQIIVKSLQSQGEGLLALQFEQLKNKLKAEGLFNEELKKPIPQWNNCIALITSSTGAAQHDVISTIENRWPLTKIHLYPSLVQGDKSIESIVSAIWQAQDNAQIDVILLVRGGGSLEDLWSFNSEEVARAVANCTTAIVSGIGHETDFTICDFVADYRAQTPTAAAVLVTPDQSEVLIKLSGLQTRIHDAFSTILNSLGQQLDYIQKNLSYLHPAQKIENNSQRVLELKQKAKNLIHQYINQKSGDIKGLVRTLNSYNPDTILSRGYSILSDKEGNLIRDTNNTVIGQNIHAKLHKGKLLLKVKEN